MKRVVEGVLLAAMISLVASALVWGRGDGLWWRQRAASVLLVAYGGDGDVPALAVISPPDTAMVLLPGGMAAARELREALLRRGYSRMEMMFMPTASPFPKGAALLSRRLQIAGVMVARDRRSRLDWTALHAELLHSGCHMEELAAAGKDCWRWAAGYAVIEYRKLPEGCFELAYSEGGKVCVTAALLRSGELRIGLADGRQRYYPRINSAGSDTLPLRRQEEILSE